MSLENFFKAFVIAISVFCSGCYGEAMSKNELEKLINENLQLGSSNEQILRFLNRCGWMYDFDRHAQRYQARDPAEDKLPDIYGGYQIYIYVDEEKRFVKAKVEKVFNSL